MPEVADEETYRVSSLRKELDDWLLVHKVEL